MSIGMLDKTTKEETEREGRRKDAKRKIWNS
jgi:hypothetical protein